MFDFTINDCGDLVVDKECSDIKKCESSSLVRQLALVRIKSVSNDWFMHNAVGADLELAIGEIVDEKTLYIVEDLILKSLMDIIHQDNIYITSTIIDTKIISCVFIRVTETITEMIKVEIDLVGGVNVIYEIDSQ